ncbi:CLUMA_CG013406, isoform A [Clunio marinus]|uniref:Tetraspanin n=1 Tax=Clunio marinus TaxID=568069 RepID=A0A1J1IM26_9DIPT|nr:CLUMA_CG013406, isoform A [Clunio marinus]
MGLSCGMSMVKYGLFIFNLICAVAGVALIVVGAIPLFRLYDVKEAFPEHNPALIPILVLILGSLIFTISFFGCCGAIRENQCMVSTYAFFLFVLVVLQIVLAVYAFIYTEELAQASVNGFQILWNQKQTSPSTMAVIDGIQTTLQCCGLNGPTDWANPPAIGRSCCPQDAQTCEIPNAFQTGCSEALRNSVEASGMLIAWFAVVFAGFELVGVIFACCLANSIRNSSRRQYA